MSLSTRVFLIVLLLTTTCIFRGTCTDTCECDTTYSSDSERCGLPPPPAIEFCDNEYDEDAFDSNVANIRDFCANGCLDLYLSCVENSDNCTDRRETYFVGLCARHNANNSYCWELFASATNDMILNCTRNQDPCEVPAGSKNRADCEEFDCRTNLNGTRDFLGCCAEQLFDEGSFAYRPSTNTIIYDVCDVLLPTACITTTTACITTTTTSTPTPTSAAKDARSFIALIGTVVSIAAYIIYI